MKESDWAPCNDPNDMVRFLSDSGKLSERKARLFAVACCFHCFWYRLLDDHRIAGLSCRHGLPVIFWGRGGSAEPAAAPDRGGESWSLGLSSSTAAAGERHVRHQRRETMSVRLLIAMCLLILGAGTTGCGTSQDRKAEAGSSPSEPSALVEAAAPKQKAADKEADEKEKERARRNARMEEARRQRAFLLGLGKGPAPADSVKVKVEVELRGTLSHTEKETTISLDKERLMQWVLEFGDDQEMRAKAKGLEGKVVVVKGSAILRGIRHLGGTSVLDDLDLERKVTVKSLDVASKE
jgi:hypothetical protein